MNRRLESQEMEARRLGAPINSQASFAKAQTDSSRNKLRISLDETHQGHHYPPHQIDEGKVAAVEPMLSTNNWRGSAEVNCYREGRNFFNNKLEGGSNKQYACEGD